MTRLRLSVISVAGLTLMTLACTNPAPAPAPTPAPAQQAANMPSAAGGPHAQNTIVFTRNTGHPDPNLSSTPCIGTATTYRMPAMRKFVVKWHLDDDNFNGCTDFDPTKVTLVFTNIADNSAAAIWVDPNDSSKTTNILRAKNTKIDGTVADSAADKRYKYVVRYQPDETDFQASPDPEIDISGDCGSCGPPGGQ